MTTVLALAMIVAICVAWSAAALLTLVGRRAHPFARLARTPSPALRAAGVLAPAMLALIALVLTLAPEPFGGCHCTTHGLHHPHLCLRHPLAAASVITPAVALVSTWMVVAAWRVARILREVVRGELWAARLRRQPADLLDGIPVRLVDDLALGAFTVGVVAPVIVVDRGLWERLSVEERRVVLHHERAHVARRDGLTLAVLRLAGASVLWPWAQRHIDAWRAATEVVCDRHAASVVGDHCAVARTLVSVERIRAGTQMDLGAPALGVAADGELEQRVHALLDGAGQSPRLASDLLTITVVWATMIGLSLVWPGSAFHHAVETVLGLVIGH